MLFRYEVRVSGQTPLCGDWEGHAGENRLVLRLPEGKLESVCARGKLSLGETEKIFMNGYQTWTYCPEYGRLGTTRDVGPLPELLLRGLGIRSYGDYDFVPYPKGRGKTHGESWCYFREGERFRLFASLDERPGYTLFRYDAPTSTLHIERDCRGVRSDGAYPALDLFYAEGTEDEVFDAWFAAMDIECRTKEKIAGYSSWYNRYEDISAQSIREDLEGCRDQLRPGDLFQIDDGWEPAVGDWLEADEKKFPQGMKAAADEIHAAGFLSADPVGLVFVHADKYFIDFPNTGKNLLAGNLSAHRRLNDHFRYFLGGCLLCRGFFCSWLLRSGLFYRSLLCSLAGCDRFDEGFYCHNRPHPFKLCCINYSTITLCCPQQFSSCNFLVPRIGILIFDHMLSPTNHCLICFSVF